MIVEKLHDGFQSLLCTLAREFVVIDAFLALDEQGELILQQQDAHKLATYVGEELGISFEFIEQPSPDGLAQAFILGEDFIGKDDVCLVLGDNIFYGRGFSDLLQNTLKSTVENKKASVFGYYVSNPKTFGVVELDNDFNAHQNNGVALASPVPLPAGIYLFLSGLVGLGLMRGRNA